MPPHFPPELQQQIHAAVERFWFDETGEEPGIMQRDRVLEFFTKLLGAAAYNQAIADAQAYLSAKLTDMEADLHEPMTWRPEQT